ncbi:MAG: DUF1990 family protein [Rubricoccaceae bacterium]
MPARPLVTLLPWTAAAGAAAAAWLWARWGYRVRSHRRDVPFVRVPEEAPDEPGRAPVQHVRDGRGPYFHRRYRVVADAPRLAPEALMQAVRADIQAFVPAELAVFEKTRGAPGGLAAGDEFVVRINSPWDGPVRVLEAGPAAFAFATLEGHMEAGQIRFAATTEEGSGALVFTIESYARSRDALVDLVYDKLPLAQAAQQAMWTFFCMRAAEASGGTVRGEVEVLTERAAA